MIYQVQYRISGRAATKKLIAASRTAWVEGRPLPQGVKIEAIAWTGTVEGLKAAIKAKRAYFGEPGIVKQYAEDNQTFCDFDSDWRLAIGPICRLARMLEIEPLWLREDKTRRGWHMVICWNRSFTPLELVALQCVLGSDRQREAYNLARVMSGKKSPRWNLLFERKIEK